MFAEPADTRVVPANHHVTSRTLCQTVSMVDEQEPAKRVVKRVVKKTVVRPVAPPEAPPVVRYGRPVSTATKPQAKLAPGKRPERTSAAPKTKPERHSIDVGAKLGAAGHRLSDTWWVVADSVRDGSTATGRFLATRARRIAAWRLPHINLYLASVITGAVVGLTAVGLGFAAIRLFDQVRGVSTGGGLWGGLAFIAISLIVAWLGRALLAGFGSRSARLTSVLGVIVTIFVILGLFLDQVQSSAAVVIIPLLAIASYAVAHWLIELAENTPAEID